MGLSSHFFFFFQAEDGIRDSSVTGVQTCALPILKARVEILTSYPPDHFDSCFHNGRIADALSSFARRSASTLRLILREAVRGKSSSSKIGRASCRERV